jgi:putative tricarboxylic transport membrane protein
MSAGRFTRTSGRVTARARRLAAAGLAATRAGCAAAVDPPSTECVAPANPGGGWDLTCRATADVLGRLRLMPGALHVRNVPGQGGGVAFTQVAVEMADNEGIIVAASPSTLLGLAQGKFGGLDEHSVRWVAAVGAEPSVVAVRADAPWRTLADLMADWRADPGRIRIGGGSAVGGQDHMKMLMLARAAGVDVALVNYRSFNGPAEAITSMLADSVQVFPGDVSEVQGPIEDRKLRVLAVLAPERAAGVLASVPTAREQGIDVSWVVWRGFFAPPGMSDRGYHVWVERLTRMAASPQWKAALAENGLTPFFLAGRPFEEFVQRQTAEYRAASREIGMIR